MNLYQFTCVAFCKCCLSGTPIQHGFRVYSLAMSLGTLQNATLLRTLQPDGAQSTMCVTKPFHKQDMITLMVCSLCRLRLPRINRDFALLHACQFVHAPQQSAVDEGICVMPVIGAFSCCSRCLDRVTSAYHRRGCLHTARQLCHATVACSPNFGWVDLDVLAVGPDGLSLLVPLQWLSHIVCIASVIVVVDDPSVHRIPGSVRQKLVEATYVRTHPIFL